MKQTKHMVIIISEWLRREHFAFFSNMADPYFSLTARVDFTDCYKTAKDNDESFFLHYIHRIMKAVNSVPELLTRIEDGVPVQYESACINPTIARENGSFGMTNFEYFQDFSSFKTEAHKKIYRVKKGTSLCMNDNESPDGRLRMSVSI